MTKANRRPAPDTPKGLPQQALDTFDRVSPRVRRAFLCGEDRLTGRSFEHRWQWVEDRIRELAGIFGVAIRVGP